MTRKRDDFSNNPVKTPFKLLLLGINYAPDFIGIPKYTTELCEDLVKRGHVVDVVTAPPYYPAWVIPADYKGAWRSERLAGVSVIRAPLYVPGTPTGLTRLMHHLSFAVSAFPAVLAVAIKKRPDMIFVVAPSLLSAPIALVIAKIVGARTWLHIQDFEIDAAFELGMLKGKFARRCAESFEKHVLRRFDRVSTISGSMVALLGRKGVAAAAITELRNWVDVDAIAVEPVGKSSYRSELNIPADHVVALYSGNMSGKQGLEKLAQVVELLDTTESMITVILCGQGPLRKELEAQCEGRSNVRFIDLQPAERFSELLGTADIHLLPQRSEAADLVLPSKLTGMLASGRPVVAMADEGTGLAAEIQGCGFAVPPADAQAMALAVLKLAGDDGLRASLGRAARRRAEDRWRKATVIDGFEAEARKLLRLP
jgi:colanic acid biosynthesis glycosyl transferase WcaI